MKFAAVVLAAALAAPATLAFAPAPIRVRPSSELAAEIRGPTKKAGAISLLRVEMRYFVCWTFVL